MKKIVFILAVFLAGGLMIASCASDKKSKKNPVSSISVEVTPSSLGEITASSPTRTLTASVKNNGVEIAGAAVSWVVNPSTGLGVCSPNPSNQTVFTANMSSPGQGTIVASYNGVNSAPVQFSVNNPITVEITPSSLGEITASSPTRTLTASVKNNGVEIAGAAVSWTVNPAAYGTCSPDNAAQTVFTANLSETGQGNITASYNGVNSAPVLFSLNETPTVIDAVAINPSSPQSILSDQTAIFTATVMSGTTTHTGSAYPVSWTATGGTVSPNPSDSGASVTFTPSISSGTATVKASYGAINSSVVNIVVVSTYTPASRYLIYGDAGLGTGVCSAFGKYSSPNADSSMSEITGGSPVDSAKAQKVVYTVYTGQPGTSWAGWYMLFGTSLSVPVPVDMSAYSKLTIWLKGEIGGEKVGIEVENSAGAKKREYFVLTTAWTKYELDISSIKSSPIKIPLNIVFAGDNGCSPGTIYFDFVSFE